jgi:hypothetical protein
MIELAWLVWAWFWNKRNNDWGCIGCEIFLEGLAICIIIIMLVVKCTMMVEDSF